MRENLKLYDGRDCRGGTAGKSGDAVSKKIAWRNVKISVTFSGNPGKSEEIRYLNLYEPMSWQF